MSRSLGHKARHKATFQEISPEAEGRAAFAAGVPVTRNPHGAVRGFGRALSWARGWQRAAAEARGKKTR